MVYGPRQQAGGRTVPGQEDRGTRGGAAGQPRQAHRRGVPAWLEKYAKPKVAPRTLESYTQIVEQHLIPALGRIPIVKLSPTHLQEYYLRALQSDRKDGKPGGCLLGPSFTTIEYCIKP
ncbi:MAG TPA: hypothetical protein GX507_06325 [Clostridia bacterium]|nr:hypothetical protein [Clostridia bacterium]